jgi:hypothetical protein
MQFQPAAFPGLELKDVIPSAIRALDPHIFSTTSAGFCANIPASSHVLVLLIDGLGELQLEEFGAGMFVTESTVATPMRTQFPSTTPVALGSLGTGQSPGRHGFVGASFYVPEEDALLAPLKWGTRPHPLSMIPTAPLFEWASERGIDVASIAREKHRNSGITKSVLRGGVYLGSADLVEMERIVRDRIAHAHAPALTYLYWPELDRIGHIHGPGSDPWLQELRSIDAFVCRIAQAITVRPNTDISLVITSDHGMVTCPLEHRIHIESNAELARDVEVVAGEPRARHIYTRSGAARETIARWRSVLGTDFTVVSREELIRGRYFPDLDPDFHDRLGDFMAIATSDALLASNSDPRSSALLGQHGSLSSAEMLIPFRVFHSGVNNQRL